MNIAIRLVALLLGLFGCLSAQAAHSVHFFQSTEKGCAAKVVYHHDNTENFTISQGCGDETEVLWDQRTAPNTVTITVAGNTETFSNTGGAHFFWNCAYPTSKRTLQGSNGSAVDILCADTRKDGTTVFSVEVNMRGVIVLHAIVTRAPDGTIARVFFFGDGIHNPRTFVRLPIIRS